MYRRIVCLSAVILLVLTLTGLGSAETIDGLEKCPAQYGTYYYSVLEDGSAEIRFYQRNSSMGTVMITVPEMLAGHPVKRIGDNAFDDANLNSIEFPEGLLTIGVNAVSGHRFLRRIILPESLKEIGDYAFADNEALTYIQVPDSVEIIGDNPFMQCEKLTDIHISDNHPCLRWVDGMLYTISDHRLVYCPQSCTQSTFLVPADTRIIGGCAFYGCKAIKRVGVCQGLEEIGDNAFAHCSSLKHISLPTTITRIGENPFMLCEALDDLRIGPDHPTLSLVDGALYFTPERRLVWYPLPNEAETCVVCEGTRIIGGGAFNRHPSLKTVQLPEGLEEIRQSAFAWCPELTHVNLPESLKRIGTTAFMFDTKLEEIVLPEGLEQIGRGAFFDCYHVTKAVIPDSVYSIGYAVFSGAKGLVELRLPEGLKSIGQMDYSSTALESVDIPASVESIGTGSFMFCDSLRSVQLHPGLKKIGMQAFAHCEALSDIVLPEGLESIGEYAFWQCESLATLTIPRSVTSIGEHPFLRCNQLMLKVYPGSYAERYLIEAGKTNYELIGQ